MEQEVLTVEQVGTVSVNPVTAWRMLKDFKDMKEGDWFVRNGTTSAVGRAAIQLGNRWRLKNIAIVRGRPGEEQEKLKRELGDLGATHVATDEEMMQKGLRDKTKEWTNGGRADVKLGLNCVGEDPAMAMAKLLSPGGCMVTYGAMSRAPMRVGASMLDFPSTRRLAGAISSPKHFVPTATRYIRCFAWARRMLSPVSC